MDSSLEDPSPRRERLATKEPVTWEVKRVRSEAEGRKAIGVVLGTMDRLGYSHQATHRVGRALAHAVRSALCCSRQGEGGGRVSLYYQVSDEYLLAEVEGRPQKDKAGPLRGPHAADLLQPPADGDPLWMRSYTWLRCRRWDDHFSLCAYLAVP
jgi:hypothetical protein